MSSHRGTPPSGGPLMGLLVLFVGSGAAALIYEVVWFQMLQLVIGASGISLGILLATFMAGMCLGSLALPRLAPVRWRPLRVYAGLEIGIGVLALVLLVLIPGVRGVYADFVPRGLSSVLLRAGVCALLLLPPTVLMGATLPAIARQVDTTPRGVAWMGFFYAGNITGAVVGALAAGFFLLPVFDVRVATFAGLALNALVAAAALVLDRFVPYAPPSTQDPEGGPGMEGTPSPEPLDETTDGPPSEAETTEEAAPGGRSLVYVAIGLSGLAALGAEVVWTRLLSLLLGATTYTFSLILGVFLAGLGLGSGVGSWLASRVRAPQMWFAAFQLLAMASVAWSAYAVGSVLVSMPIDPEVMSDPRRLLPLDLARTAFAILPAPVCWGASFPLAVAAAARRGRDPGRLIAGVYAANTLGAIAGSIGVGIFLIPLLGTHESTRVVLLLSAATAGLLVLAAPGGARRRTPALLAGAALTAVLAVTLVRPPDALFNRGRHAAQEAESLKTLYVGEGLAATVAVTEHSDSVRSFRIQGKIAASTSAEDMVLQRMLGHYSALLHRAPRSVLVVGFGAGVTAGAFVTHPGVERIVICEIEALTTERVGPFFAEENHGILDDPRVEIVHDDARHFLLTTDETFDVITSDPIHPWVKGAASLYTREYFELAAAHLRPGGVVTQWVPLYESTMEVVRSELATFFTVFPRGTLWSSHLVTRGFDVVMAARPDGMVVDVEALEARLGGDEYADVRASLGEVGFRSMEDLASAYFGQAPDLADWLGGAVVNRDRDLKLMYLAGLGLNQSLASEIHAELMRYRVFPEGVIVATPERLTELRRSMSIDVF